MLSAVERPVERAHGMQHLFSLSLRLISVAHKGTLPYEYALCNQLFLNENACSGDESTAKVLFEHPSTTFVYTKT